MIKAEDQKSIAEFMGYEVKEHHKNPGFWLYLKEKGVENDKEYTCWASIDFDLNYGSSWDKLMPVIDKIEAMGYDVWFQTRRSAGTVAITIWDKDKAIVFTKPIRRTKLEAINYAVVEFIKWHNALTLSSPV